MNISSNYSLFNWTAPVNRYTYLPQLFTQNQNNAFFPGVNFPDNNYSYFTTQKVADDFTNLGKKAEALNLSKTGNVFEKAGASATSGNTKAVTAEAANGATQGTYNLQVSQVAKAQENAGKWVEATDKTLAVDGKQAFTISTADSKGLPQKSVNIEAQTKAGQTNKEVLAQTAQLINKKGQELGVQARVETQTTDGVEQARLVVTGAKTGTNAGTFAVKDTTGTLTANTGINDMTTVAQNAKYTLNGFAHENQSNEINVDRFGQVKATLKNVTAPGETVKITVKPQDATSIYNKVKDFANQYNQTVRDLSSPENRPTANMNQNFGLTQINSADRNKLVSMGISVNADHTLSLNENRFRTALAYEPDKVREVLGGSNGFAAKVEEKAENVDLANHFNPNMNWNNINGYYPGRFFNYYL